MFADRQGSVIWVTDPAAGTALAAYEYDGYGQITQTQGTLSQPYGYTGREYDAESGLYHYRARAYDPASGVFLQSDPIGFWSGFANIYGYVEGNPANHLDPSGMNATLDAAKLGGTGGLSLMALFAPLNEDGDTLAGGILGVATSIFKELDADAASVGSNGKDPCERLVDRNSETSRFIESDAIASGDDFVATVAGVGTVAKLGYSGTKATVAIIRSVFAKKNPMSVYISVQGGKISYVGITNNMARRSAEHLRDSGRIITEVRGLPKRMDRLQARAIEQAVIDKVGLKNLSNHINSIARTNPDYALVAKYGIRYLDRFGL
ncbi:RHS repeat-associated core domain-containing protein [Aliiroseovarius halocynthiae]|uniref:RHS repeat-associated core domain-containing protein n=2 Tax=Aliiroseovarius halocynthiae TaxID=985055 RepID=UPI0024B7DADF|nr:RHS repeat-associated core domain-containing protein [Aliiroseovarius halocynthiae]